MRHLLPVVLLLCLGAGSAALAEEDPELARQAAEKHFAEGQAHLKARRLAEASVAFMRAADAAASVGWAEKEAAALHHAGVSASQGGLWPQAIAAFERQAKVEQARGNRLGEANAILNVGIIQWRLGMNDMALATYGRSLAIHEAEQNRSGVAKVLGLMGSVWRSKGDLAKALEHQQRSLVITDELGDQLASALTRGNIANIHTDLGQPAAALVEQRKVLAIQKELGDELRVTNTLYNIGSLLAEMGRLRDALTHHRDAMTRRRRMGDRQGIAVSHFGIGWVYMELQRYRDSEVELQAGLRLAREIGDRSWIARGLAHLGTLYAEIGDPGRAIECHSEALELHRAMGRAIGAADSLGRIASAYLLQGRFAKAVELQQEAVMLARALRAKVVLAARLNDLGMAYARMGRTDDGHKALRESAALYKAIGDLPRHGQALHNVAAMLRDAGRAPEALAPLKASLAIAEQLGDVRLHRHANTVMASVLADLGRLEEAQAVHTADLERYRAAGDVRGEMHALTGLASIAIRVGEAEAARRLRVQALQLAEDTGDDVARLTNMWGLAATEMLAGKHADALAWVDRGIRVVERLAAGLSDEEMAGARESSAQLFDIGLWAAAALKDVEAFARVLERGRAVALLDALGAPGTLSETVLPAELLHLEREGREAEVRALAVLRSAAATGKRKAMRAARAELDKARQVRLETSRKIQREARAAADLVMFEPAPLSSLQAALGNGQVMVSYALTQSVAYALVVTPKGSRIVDLGPAAPLRDACRTLGLHEVDAGASERIAALVEAVVTPLALPTTATQVIVSPHGELCSAPLGALWTKRAVASVPSATTWVRMRAEGASAPGKGVLAIGDPDYAAFSKSRQAAAALHRGGHARLMPLPGTRVEVEAIGTQTLLGAKATEAGVRQALGGSTRWRSLHIACHGLLDTEHPLLSSLALTPDPADPLNDGFLTALDVLRMRVPADLVVLSACETGRGAVYHAEGVVGLPRAFMFAGARSVMSSLWKVDDESTRALMIKFYELWEGRGEAPSRLPAAEALRRAQAHVRAQEGWEHPYYWAAWVLWGAAE